MAFLLRFPHITLRLLAPELTCLSLHLRYLSRGDGTDMLWYEVHRGSSLAPVYTL